MNYYILLSISVAVLIVVEVLIKVIERLFTSYGTVIVSKGDESAHINDKMTVSLDDDVDYILKTKYLKLKVIDAAKNTPP